MKKQYVAPDFKEIPLDFEGALVLGSMPRHDEVGDVEQFSQKEKNGWASGLWDNEEEE